MTAITFAAPSWQWPADVIQFAVQRQVETYLEPLLGALQRLYPTVTSSRVFLSEDPEILDDRHIVFDVRLSQKDVPDYVAAMNAWDKELFRICPAPLVCTFRLLLVPLDSRR